MMFIFSKPQESKWEKRYQQLLLQARKAQQQGNMQQYSTLVAEANRALVHLFSPAQEEPEPERKAS